MIHVKEIHKRAFAKAYLTNILLALLLVSIASNAQSITKSTFSNGGGEIINADTTLSFTLGEPIVGIINNGNSISQGFWAGVSEGGTLSINNSVALNKKITAFPNPVKNEMTLSLTSKAEVQSTLRIYDSTGRLVYQFEWGITEGAQSHHINCESWAGGLYLIQIELSDEMISECVLLTN